MILHSVNTIFYSAIDDSRLWIICVFFSSITERRLWLPSLVTDCFSQVRFELKTDKGSFMVSLEPPPEELLFPEPVSRAEFQRVRSSLGQLDSETVDCQVSKLLALDCNTYGVSLST